MPQGKPALSVRRFVLTLIGVALIIPVASSSARALPPQQTAVRAAQDTPANQWPMALSDEQVADIWKAPPPPPGPNTSNALQPSSYGTASPPRRATATAAALVVSTAINFARQQLGLPYVWGGNGPGRGDAGFDCSGLTQSAYMAGGLLLPRTAMAEYYAGPHVPPAVDLQPGDLLFYGTPSRVHHVGLYVGRLLMIHAPTFGQNVQVSSYRWSGDDYLGATRPTESLGGLGGYIPELPSRLPSGYQAGSSSGMGGSPTGSGAPAAKPAPAPAPAPASGTGTGAKPAPGSAPAPGPTPAPTKPPPALPVPLPSLPVPLPSLPVPLPPIPTIPPIPPTTP